MQELEKILEEIEQAKREPWYRLSNYDVKHKLDGAINRIIDIIRKYINDGWIPVEERLPEVDGFYIATMDGGIVGQEETFVGLAELENGLWVDDDIDYKCIIAWRPLPDPYRPVDKTEAPDWREGMLKKFDRRA